MCCSCFDLQPRPLFRDSAKWLCEMSSSKFSLQSARFSVGSAEPPGPGVWDLAGVCRKEGRLRRGFLSCPALLGLAVLLLHSAAPAEVTAGARTRAAHHSGHIHHQHLPGEEGGGREMRPWGIGFGFSSDLLQNVQ